MSEAPALELRRITKRFGTLVANRSVDFDVRRGEIHALLGENGAGKSTLMNVLYGLHQPDEGEIRLGGEPVRIDSPRRAIGLGIGMVHQHFMLVPVMTVAENLVLGAEPHKGLLLDYKVASARVRELSERFGLAVDPDAKVVFQVAGQCGLGVLDAAKQKSVQGIGVDADQAYLGDQIMTSALKKVDVAVYNEVKALQDDTFKGGANAIFDVKSGGVGIGKTNSIGAKYDAQIKEQETKISSGALTGIPDTVK